jgi:hypothetical protein
VAEQFRRAGVVYRVADKPKSDLYRDFLPAVNSRQVELLDHPRLLAQLASLERRTAHGGGGSIDHPPGGHDDLANAAALVRAADRARRSTALVWGSDASRLRPRRMMFARRFGLKG